MPDLYEPIKQSEKNGNWKSVPIIESYEKLVPLSRVSQNFVAFEPEYHLKGIPGSINECYLREGVLNLLEKASRNLPKGCRFMILDAWRPIEVQKYLFDNFVDSLVRQAPHKSMKEILLLAQQFVSYPSSDPRAPAPHNTGGALDITITDENGIKLDMETEFDSFSKESGTRFYEEQIEKGRRLTAEETVKCGNRRMLYNILTQAGFSNYPNEWWHYDYGNQFWGFYGNRNAFYGMIKP